MEKPKTYVDKLTDKEIKLFIVDYLQSFDEEYFEEITTKALRLDRERKKLRVFFKYNGDAVITLQDFKATMKCKQDADFIKLPQRWFVFLAKKWPKEYVESLYKDRERVIKKDYNDKMKTIKKIVFLEKNGPNGKVENFYKEKEAEIKKEYDKKIKMLKQQIKLIVQLAKKQIEEENENAKI